MILQPHAWWAAAAVLFAAVAGLGVAALLLEAEGHARWLACWWGGALLAAVCGRRWEMARRVPRGLPHGTAAT
jgi:hypothetical protein